jgi:hypothetical protein
MMGAEPIAMAGMGRLGPRKRMLCIASLMARCLRRIATFACNRHNRFAHLATRKPPCQNHAT